MDGERLFLTFSERTMLTLRSLYISRGYRQYRMGKFEPYDLYANNKDFLVSDSVITFTDTNGKLMALKPDVTLSIIKNSKDEDLKLEKVFYNENVYRISKGTRTFKEIMQTGLECFGRLDRFQRTEVISLAARSLCLVSGNSVLDLSNLDLVSNLIAKLGPGFEGKDRIIKALTEKNPHDIKSLCRAYGIGEDMERKLVTLATSYGRMEEVFPLLRKCFDDEDEKEALDELEATALAVDEDLRDSLRIDFSVIPDMNYYDGIVFKGFIEGIPESVLSGGCYDKLMEKLGRKASAIGFALYLDLLEALDEADDEDEADILLLYGESDDEAGLEKTANELSKKNRVFVSPLWNDKVKAGRRIRFGKEVE